MAYHEGIDAYDMSASFSKSNNTTPCGQKPTDTARGDATESIKAIVSLFYNDRDKLSGEATEVFTQKLQTLLEQIKASYMPEQHLVSALYSVLIKGGHVASKLQITSLTMKEFINELKRELLYEPNISEKSAEDGTI